MRGPSLVVFSVLILLEGASLDDKLNVEVLFESLCPDSLRFIRDQLHPNWQTLAPYVNLKLVPFGKSALQTEINFGIGQFRGVWLAMAKVRPAQVVIAGIRAADALGIHISSVSKVSRLVASGEPLAGPSKPHRPKTVTNIDENQASLEGGAKFVCQHGPAECSGNRILSCALERLEQNAQVEYTACFMSAYKKGAPDGLPPAQQCAQAIGLPFEDVLQCYQSKEGTQHQLVAELATARITPKFVPTILYNGEFNQNLQDASLINFRGVVCEFIKSVAPEICQSSL